MKILLRAIFIINVSIYFSIMIMGKQVVDYLNSSQFALIFSTMFMVLGTLYLWVLMFYHWGTSEFKSKLIKNLWFLSMIFGLYAGAYIYYVFVYELRKTIQKR